MSRMPTVLLTVAIICGFSGCSTDVREECEKVEWAIYHLFEEKKWPYTGSIDEAIDDCVENWDDDWDED